MKKTQQLCRRIYRCYAKSVGLDPEAHYMHGTPLRPVVPLDTAVEGLFVIGAYPSARFHQIGNVRDVPVGDNLGPFEHERWFDGARVREQPSAAALNRYFLEPMGLARKQCWITNLVKVFLFKSKYQEKYRSLGATPPAGFQRGDFHDLGARSVPFLEEELRLAKPKLVVTLGREVAGVLNGIRSGPAQSKLLVPSVTKLRIGEETVSAIHCPHPGILMRPIGRKWAERQKREFIPELQRAWAKDQGSIG